MKNSKTKWLEFSIFLAISILICPSFSPIIGYDLSSTTEAIKIYFWTGSLFFLLIALLNVSTACSWVRRVLRVLVMILLTLGSIEVASSFTYRLLTGKWSHVHHMNFNRFLFRPHPYLVGSPIENTKYERDGLVYSHNSLGYRGAEFSRSKPEGKIRIATIGGSTTYGVGVNINETWPYQLSELLGSKYEVINLGVPGYSSAENLIQSAFHLSDLRPDLVIYYIGLNDLRNINVKNLKPDYSDFHAPSLYGALGLCANENIPALAMLKMMIMAAQGFGLIEGCPSQKINPSGTKHEGVDKRALSLYERNLRSIGSLCKSQQITVLFVPNVLSKELLSTGNFNWWIPYVPNSEIDDMMHAYNLTLRQVAIDSETTFADQVLNHEWTKDDFVDLSHFNKSGNRKLAEILSSNIEQLAKSETESDF